jgi:hypothetical protein
VVKATIQAVTITITITITIHAVGGIHGVGGKGVLVVTIRAGMMMIAAVTITITNTIAMTIQYIGSGCDGGCVSCGGSGDSCATIRSVNRNRCSVRSTVTFGGGLSGCGCGRSNGGGRGSDGGGNVEMS